MEFAWVLLNYLGIEQTTTEPVVRYVGDIHTAYMPFSHSILTALAAALLAWSIAAAVGRARLGGVLALGILSTLFLDPRRTTATSRSHLFRVHRSSAHFWTGRLPLAAFLLELGYGCVCWRVFRGTSALLALIVGFNLANVSLFFRAIPGPEDLMAGRPLLLVTVILVQIIATLWAVWWVTL